MVKIAISYVAYISSNLIPGFMLVLSIIWIFLSNAVDLRRDLAILYSRLAISNYFLFYNPRRKNNLFTQKVLFLGVIMLLLQSFSFYALFGINPVGINLNNAINFLIDWLESPVFCLEYKHIYALCKIFAFTVANYIFAKNFITDFSTKHKFPLNRFDWESIKKYIYKFILFLIFMIVCRFIIRNCLLKYFFDNTEFISLVLCVLWILPLSNYVMNIAMKLITRQKIEKQDWNIFNSNVAENTNVYTVCFILAIVYISYFHLQYFYPLIWKYCLSLVGMGEGDPKITFSFPHLDKNIIESLLNDCKSILKGEIDSGIVGKLQIVPSDYPFMFTENEGSVSNNRSRVLGGQTHNHWFTDRLIGDRHTHNGHYSRWHRNFIGKNVQTLKRNTLVMSRILNWEANNGVRFLMNTMVISYNTNHHLTFGVVIGEHANGRNILYIGMHNRGLPNSVPYWGVYRIIESSDMERWKQNLIDWGIDTRRILEYPISEIQILTPFKYENEDISALSKYYYSYDYKDHHTSNSVIVNINDRTHIKDVCKPLPLYPHNLGQVFGNNSQAVSFDERKHCLDVSRAHKPYVREMLTSNKFFTGHTWLGQREIIAQIIRSKDVSLPLVRSSIQSNYIIEGISELNINLGLELNNTNIDKVELYTQASNLKGNWYKLPMFSYGYDDIKDINTVINFPWSGETMDSLPIRFTTVIQEILNYLDETQSWNSQVTWGNQDPDIKEMKEKMLNRDLMQAFEQSTLFEDPHKFDSNTTIYKIKNSNERWIICRSSQSIFEELFWNNNSSTLTLKNNISPMTRKLIHTPLHSRYLNNLIQSPDKCIHINRQLNILFLDKFCAELAITNVNCHDDCPLRRARRVDTYQLKNIIWKDNDGNEKKILNLLDINDLNKLFSYLERYLKKD